MQNNLFVLSFLPLIILVGLLVSRKTNILVSTAITATATLFISIVIWRMDALFIFASGAKSISIAFDIFIIIFGATLFWQFLEQKGVVQSMRFYLSTVSSDIRVQVILLAWFFGGLIEGIAGFGTPAAIIAPLLIGVGLSPLLAVAIPLITNSTAVIFGAVGTPIRVGFSSLPIEGVAGTAALINGVGIIIPLCILFVLSDISRNRKSFIIDAVPFSLISGFAFVAPYMVAAQFGYEFPSIIGAIAGAVITVVLIKKNLYIPNNTHPVTHTRSEKNNYGLGKVLLPYAVLTLFLIAAKFIPASYTVVFADGIRHTLHLLNPGVVFIITILCITPFYKDYSSEKKISIFSILAKALVPFLVILCISVTTQIMIHTDHNTSGYQSMMRTVSTIIHSPILPFIAPFLGAFGAFIAGSATVSNMLLGTVVYDAAQSLGMNTTTLLALQLVGAGVGNMVAISNIVAAMAVVGLHGKELSILKKVVIPCFIYLALVGLIGLVQ